MKMEQLQKLRNRSKEGETHRLEEEEEAGEEATTNRTDLK